MFFFIAPGGGYTAPCAPLSFLCQRWRSYGTFVNKIPCLNYMFIPMRPCSSYMTKNVYGYQICNELEPNFLVKCEGHSNPVLDISLLFGQILVRLPKDKSLVRGVQYPWTKLQGQGHSRSMKNLVRTLYFQFTLSIFYCLYPMECLLEKVWSKTNLSQR